MSFTTGAGAAYSVDLEPAGATYSKQEQTLTTLLFFVDGAIGVNSFVMRSHGGAPDNTTFAHTAGAALQGITMSTSAICSCTRGTGTST